MYAGFGREYNRTRAKPKLTDFLAEMAEKPSYKAPKLAVSALLWPCGVMPAGHNNKTLLP